MFQRLRNLVATALAASFLASLPVSAQQATFTIRYEDKLFINTIPLLSCNPLAVVGAATPDRIAAYVAFCQATSLGENPPTGAIVAPLDARIRAGVDLIFRCRIGNPTPVVFGGMAPLATAGGLEGPTVLGITGKVNPTTIRNQIVRNGSFGAVFSGFPNLLVEPLFQIHRIRLRTNIWHKLTGQITCGADARGLPVAFISNTLTPTAFPSHKVWFTAPIRGGGPVLLFSVPQGAFSNLWSLPAVPAP